MNIGNSISTPAHGPKSLKPSDGGEGALPSSKRRRVARADGLDHKPVDYDMDHHSIDDMLRPKAAAKGRAYDQSPFRISDGHESKGCSDEDSGLDMPKLSQGLNVHPQTTAPHRHHVTRAETLGEKAVDYDMKHHPMDDVLRPKAAAKRSVWFKSASPSISPYKAAKAATTSSTSKNDPKNPFTKPVPTDWKELRAFDRRVYLLQKGSPVHGNTLPLKWFKVVEALTEDGFFTREQFKAWGGVQTLKSHYESTRVGIEGFFQAKPEPTNKMGWQVIHAEGFDVYDKSVGKKYWPTHGDSAVRPPSIKDTKTALREQIDRVDTNEELDSQDDETAAAVPDPCRAVFDGLSTSYRDAEQALQAEDHLMESMRSAPSSEIGGPMMADDELEAVLGDMVMADPTAATKASSSQRAPSSSVGDPETSLLEPRPQMGQPTSMRNDVAIALEKLDTSRKSPKPKYEAEATQSALVGIVPPSVLKTALRMEQQNLRLHHQSSTRSQPGTSASVGSSNMTNPDPDTLATNERFPTPKAPRKVYKRGARAKSSSIEFQVHEDQPGSTPLIKKQAALHPKSPGTDIKKENFGHHNQAEPDSTVAHRHLQDALTGSPRTRRRSGRPFARPMATSGFEQSSSALQPSPALVVADGRTAGIDRMGPNAFVTPLTPRSTRIRRV